MWILTRLLWLPFTYLVHKVDNLVDGVVAGEPGLHVSDDVLAEVAEEGPLCVLRPGGGDHQQQSYYQPQHDQTVIDNDVRQVWEDGVCFLILLKLHVLRIVGDNS